MSTGSLEASDAAAAAVQKTPHRVSLDSMNAKIVREIFFTGGEAARAFDALTQRDGPLDRDVLDLDVLTICIVVMQNGFTLIGKSAPADASNFNAELGRKFAREDAIRQLWPLEGYALREKLAGL